MTPKCYFEDDDDDDDGDIKMHWSGWNAWRKPTPYLIKCDSFDSFQLMNFQATNIKSCENYPTAGACHSCSFVCCCRRRRCRFFSSSNCIRHGIGMGNVMCFGCDKKSKLIESARE